MSGGCKCIVCFRKIIFPEEFNNNIIHTSIHVLQTCIFFNQFAVSYVTIKVNRQLYRVVRRLLKQYCTAYKDDKNNCLVFEVLQL